ncbi:MAG: hypothetical protein KGJ86_17370 [Chloroflexota bacterium]|nr:hypothetical protein [Chloroflexota bacterium]
MKRAFEGIARQQYVTETGEQVLVEVRLNYSRLTGMIARALSNDSRRHSKGPLMVKISDWPKP